MSLDRPLFILGTGRSGTTLLFKLLARHPELAWPCLCWQHSNGAAAVGPNHQCDPLEEPYDWWDAHYRGFRRPCRDLVAADVPPTLPGMIQAAFAAQQEAMGRARFLTKWTGWPRVRFVDVLCPDALYLHVIRDGRAVAASLMQQDWWRGWEGHNNWRYGLLSPAEIDQWERSGQSFYVLAGIQWAKCLDSTERALATIGPRTMTVRYEAFVRSPASTLDAIVAWAGLEPGRIELQPGEIGDGNAKWPTLVSVEDRRLFEAAMGPDLKRWGY